MVGLTPLDAQMFWASRRQLTDQYLLYCFAAQGDSGADPGDEEILELLHRQAREVPALAVRVARVPGDLADPRWVAAPVTAGQFRRHRGPADWAGCREAVAELLTDPLDATDHAWRVHLFGPVSEAPGSSGLAWVVVLQVSHALADGRGASELARALFGGAPAGPAPAVGRLPGPLTAVIGAAAVGPRLIAGLALGLRAWRMPEAESSPDPSGTGAPAPPPAPRAPGPFNRVPGPDRRIDTRTVSAAALRADGASVTVAVLSALAVALTEFDGGSDPEIAVELTVADERAEPGKAGLGRAGPRNNFRVVPVRLHAGVADPRERSRAIAAEIAAARFRGLSARRRAEHLAESAAPAVLRAFGVRAAPRDTPARVAGAAVVSSVNRGPADLTLAGGRVLFTAGFPALSAAHALTIGVHGIGDAVTVSVTTSPSVVPEAGRFIGLLWAELPS